MMRTRPLILTCVVVGVLGSAAALVGWVTGAQGQAVRLNGDVSYDFGEIVLSDKSKLYEHTFRLVNASRGYLHIEGVTSTCGCVGVDAEPKSIAPGESLTVNVKIAVHKPGQFGQLAAVRFAGYAQPVQLTLQARVVLPEALTALVDEVVVAHDTPRRIPVQYSSRSPGQSAPPQLKVLTPNGYSSTTGEWMRVSGGEAAASSRWQCELTIEAHEGASSGDVMLEIPGADVHLTLPVRVR